jgi:hypothetical protein
MGFGENALIVKSLSVKAEGGGKGVNLIRGTRSKLYSRLTPYLLSLRIKRDERDVKVTMVGTREGPVRIIRVIKRHTPLLLGLSTPEEVRTELYTADAAEWREETGQTLDMKRLVARSVVEERFLLDRAAAGRFSAGCASETIAASTKGGLPPSGALVGSGPGPSSHYDLAGRAAEVCSGQDQRGEAGWQVDIVSMNGRIRRSPGSSSPPPASAGRRASRASARRRRPEVHARHGMKPQHPGPGASDRQGTLHAGTIWSCSRKAPSAPSSGCHQQA